jgi:hypothetical protein
MGLQVGDIAWEILLRFHSVNHHLLKRIAESCFLYSCFLVTWCPSHVSTKHAC